jgi:hypothetical protein
MRRRFVFGRGLIISTALMLASPAFASARPVDLSIGSAGQFIDNTLVIQIQPVLLPQNNPRNTPKIKDVTTELRVDLPSGVAFESFDDTQGFTCTFDPTGPGEGGSVFCTGPLNFRSAVNIRFTTTVTAASGTPIPVFSVIDPGDLVAEFDETDNTAESPFVAP